MTKNERIANIIFTLVIIITLVFIFYFISFLHVSSDKEKLPKTKTQANIFEHETKDEYPIVVIFDSCEYICYRPGGPLGLFTHRGRCKFCEKRILDSVRIITKTNR